MKSLSTALTGITKIIGAALIASALLAINGRLLPQNTPMDDIAAFALVAFVEGVLYSVPQKHFLVNRRRAMLYLAVTAFVPFLVAFAALQYGFQATAAPSRLAANLISAGAAFLLALCPPAALLVTYRRRHSPSKPGG